MVVTHSQCSLACGGENGEGDTMSSSNGTKEKMDSSKQTDKYPSPFHSFLSSFLTSCLPLPFKITQLVPCSVFSFFRDVSESFWKAHTCSCPVYCSQILHLANNHITIALLQATDFSFAKFYLEFSDSVLVPTANCQMCESYCVWECPRGDKDDKSVHEHRQCVCPN